MRNLYYHTWLFRFFEEKGHSPFINFHQMPNISNTRWNSIANLAILIFFLILTTWTSLEKICWFISYDWADCSFSDQMYNENNFPALLDVALAKLKTVTIQTPIKRSILTRRMTLWTEHSETYSMDKGVCALGDDSGQLKVMNSIS